jgi:hypothetical protein
MAQMKSSKSHKLYNLPEHKGRQDNLQLLRVLSTPEYLKIDFGYFTTDYYTRGGWVKMDKDTIVRDTKNGRKYKLVDTVNIPIAPEEFDFNTSHDWLYFSLIFEPIPSTTKVIDVIESDPGEPTDFNLYTIELSAPKSIKK